MRSGSLSIRTVETRAIGVGIPDILGVAQGLLNPSGRNPYRLGEHPIRDLRELRENLGNLSEDEAMWIADWLEYLGDAQTASRIYERPYEFRRIINERYLELCACIGRSK